MKILTSLAENGYFLGLAALLNSVVKNGTYVDKVIVGYKGPLPNWLPALNDTLYGKGCKLTSGLPIEFIELKSDLHMVHQKPQWLKLVNDVLAPEGDEYFFFDSDIVVIKRMAFFGEWVKQGLALCEDIFCNMSANHPVRKQWETLAHENGLNINKKLEKYYNSGFLGWSKSTAIFINEWEECFNVLVKKAGDIKKYRVNDRTHVVASANQDSLNLAAMITNVPLSTMGPDAMSFEYGINIMTHAITGKPWNTNFVTDFIDGRPPRKSDLLFWQNVNGSELKPIPAFKVTYKIKSIKMFKLFARFYARG